MSAYLVNTTRAQLMLLIATYYGLDCNKPAVIAAIEELHQTDSDETLTKIVAIETRELELQTARLGFLRPYAEAADTNWSSVFVINEGGQLLAYVNTPHGDELLPCPHPRETGPDAFA